MPDPSVLNVVNAAQDWINCAVDAAGPAKSLHEQMEQRKVRTRTMGRHSA